MKTNTNANLKHITPDEVTMLSELVSAYNSATPAGRGAIAGFALGRVAAERERDHREREDAENGK